MVKYYKYRYLNKWFVAIDKNLIPFSNKLIALIPLTIIYTIFFGVRDGLFLAICFAAYTLWSYISIRKYGWLDTFTFQGVLPFMLIGALVSNFSNADKIGKIDPEKFATEAKNGVTDVINEVYTGKIVDTAVSTDEVRFIIETPFGIKLPIEKIMPELSKTLHVHNKDINHMYITDRRSYYSFNLDAMRAFEEHNRSKYEYLSLSGIKDRLLCRLPKGTSQT